MLWRASPEIAGHRGPEAPSVRPGFTPKADDSLSAILKCLHSPRLSGKLRIMAAVSQLPRQRIEPRRAKIYALYQMDGADLRNVLSPALRRPNKASSRSFEGTSTGDGRLMERERFPRAGLVTPHPGGPGIDPAGMLLDRRARCLA